MTHDTHRKENDHRVGEPSPKGSDFHAFKAKTDLLACVEERSVAALEDMYWDSEPDGDGRAVAEDIVSALLEGQTVRRPSAAIMRAGGRLSNCAYNMKQDKRIDESYRRSLKESQEAWDKAVES